MPRDPSRVGRYKIGHGRNGCYIKEDGAREVERSPKQRHVITGNCPLSKNHQGIGKQNCGATEVKQERSYDKGLNNKELIISSLKGQLIKANRDNSILSKQLTDITQERDPIILAFSLIIDETSGGQVIKPGKEFNKPKDLQKMFNLPWQQQLMTAKTVSPFQKIA